MANEPEEVDQYRTALEEIRNVSSSYDRRPCSHLTRSSPFWRGKFEGLHICAKIARKVLDKFNGGKQR
jgi:hypothetical protein